MRTRFILIETSHPGNVGAAARALKVMGFDEMVLVAPRYANVLRKEETIQRASGANDVLDKTRIVDTLEEAFEGISHVCATAMTPRDLDPLQGHHESTLIGCWVSRKQSLLKRLKNLVKLSRKNLLLL
jgi:tRNA/rRNA methyltransferase